MIFLLIWSLVCLIISFFLSNKKLLSPSVLTSVVWFFVFFLYYIVDHTLPPINTQFQIGVFLWITFFCFSSLIVQRISIKSSKQQYASKLVRQLYFIISVFTFPLIFIFAYQAITLGTSGSWSMDLRMAAVGQTENFSRPFGGLFVLLWKSAYIVELIYYSKKNRLRLILLALFYLTFGFVTMAKAVFLDFVLISVAVLYMKEKIKLRYILEILGVLLVIFMWMQSLRHSIEIGASESNEFLTIYILGNMTSFDTLEASSSLHFGENVFRFLYEFAYKIKISTIEPVNVLLPWIKEPIQTNTYTSLYPYFVDFGFKGIAISSIVLGFLAGVVYKMTKNKSDLSIAIYALCVPFFIFQYVAEMFLTNFWANMVTIVLVWLPFYIGRSKYLFIKKI